MATPEENSSRKSKSTNEPLTVLLSFLSRADSTPLDVRSRAPGHILDKDGNPLIDPAADASANAFESDTSLNFEKWGDYWRRVHGMRFVYPESADDEKILAGLLRYDQIHRAPSGPTSLNPPPYHPPVDASGKLFDTVIGHIEPYKRPDWDGVAYLNFANVEDLTSLLSSARVVNKIIPEELVIFRDLAPFLARQYIFIPADLGADSIVLIRTHVCPQALDRNDFQSYWLHYISKEVMQQSATNKFVKRYVQLHNIGPTEEGKPFFHQATAGIGVVSLFAFRSILDAETFLQTDDYGRIIEAERTHSVIQQSKYWTGLNVSVVDHLAPERPTKES